MPLLVADYSWTQTEYTVYVSVPLKGAKVGKVDILSTDEYLKVKHLATVKKKLQSPFPISFFKIFYVALLIIQVEMHG